MLKTNLLGYLSGMIERIKNAPWHLHEFCQGLTHKLARIGIQFGYWGHCPLSSKCCVLDHI